MPTSIANKISIHRLMKTQCCSPTSRVENFFLSEMAERQGLVHPTRCNAGAEFAPLDRLVGKEPVMVCQIPQNLLLIVMRKELRAGDSVGNLNHTLIKKRHAGLYAD